MSDEKNLSVKILAQMLRESKQEEVSDQDIRIGPKPNYLVFAPSHDRFVYWCKTSGHFSSRQDQNRRAKFMFQSGDERGRHNCIVVWLFDHPEQMERRFGFEGMVDIANSLKVYNNTWDSDFNRERFYEWVTLRIEDEKKKHQDPRLYILGKDDEDTEK